VATISRAKFSVEYPANFMLIASMNPCPCGYYNHPEKDCLCAPGVVQKYLNKISGPLLDRIDLHLEVTPVPFSELSKPWRKNHCGLVRDHDGINTAHQYCTPAIKKASLKGGLFDLVPGKGLEPRFSQRQF